MRGVTSIMIPRFVYVICEPPVVLAVPAVTLMIGVARVTEIFAVSLSSVTVRGLERMRASEFSLMKEKTALTPSAFRNMASGLSLQGAILAINAGWLSTARGLFVVGNVSLPAVTCCARKVPVQSI